MIPFTTYEKATGRIMYSGRAQDPSALETDTLGVLVNQEINLEGWVVDQIFHQLPDSPNEFYTFNWQTKQWEDNRNVQDVKLYKWNIIKNTRFTKLTSPLYTPFGIFDANYEAQKSITDAIMLLQTLEAAGTPTTIDFTLADNTTMTLTTAQMVQVGILLGQRTQEIYAIGRDLRAQIDAATTIAEVEAITWPTT